jgi:hypothetical protein
VWMASVRDFTPRAFAASSTKCLFSRIEINTSATEMRFSCLFLVPPAPAGQSL